MDVKRRQEAFDIGVVPFPTAVLDMDRVDGANGSCCFRAVIEKAEDVLFVRNRHVGADHPGTIYRREHGRQVRFQHVHQAIVPVQPERIISRPVNER